MNYRHKPNKTVTVCLSNRALFDGLSLPISVTDLHADQPARFFTESMQVAFVTAGWSRLGYADQEETLSPGSVLVLPGNVWFSARPVGFVRTTSIYLDAEYLRVHLRWLPSTNPLVYRLRLAEVDTRPSVMSIGEEGVRALQPKLSVLAAVSHTPTNEFATLARVADAFDALATLIARNGVMAAARSIIPREPVVRAVRALHGRLEHRWSVGELARVAGLSESQLSRLFQQDLGTSPAAYLWEARTDRIAELLASTEVTFAQAASQAGWASVSAAGRAFKRRYGQGARSFAFNARARDRSSALRDAPDLLDR
ncbi:helix-turn-helix domain-containing protein [Microbacterium sp. NPDC077663]|uniref:AraC family transcriptional regulator n=1 Tax=Microbacterium sp. NPDC077663 TaxID=3364189 RepID=UPI0037C5BB9D